MPAPQVASSDDDDEEAEAVDEQAELPSDGSTDVADDEPAQDLAEIPSDGEDIPDPGAESEQAEPADVDTADPFEGEDDIEVDLADTNVGEDATSDGPFEGDDEVHTPTGGESSSGGDQTASQIQQGMDALGDTGHLDEAINEGFARLAVVGLDDGSEKDSLEMEFCEVFEMFRLGHFGKQAVNEYILTDPDEEVDPLWAFAVSLTLSTALVVYMRPDRDEIVDSARDSLSRFTGGLSNVR